MALVHLPRRRVLAFGDSNTFGAQPSSLDGGPAPRHPREQRWPCVAAAELGDAYEIIEAGMPGRTLDSDDCALPPDYGPALSGRLALPIAIRSANPIDLVVIMLGTNDCKAGYSRTPESLTAMSGRLLDVVARTNSATAFPAPRALLVAPPPLDPSIGRGRFAADFPDASVRLSTALAGALAKAPARDTETFFDAGTVIRTDGRDGLHLTGATQRILGIALVERIRAIPL